MTERKIKCIRLGFENCEYVDLLPSMFKHLWIEGISQRCFVNCYQYVDGEVQRRLNCSRFRILILGRGLVAYTTFGQHPEKSLRERLDAHRDIVDIRLFFDNDSEEEITVPWGSEEWTNEFQRHEEQDDGLLIEIREGEKGDA